MVKVVIFIVILLLLLVFCINYRMNGGKYVSFRKSKGDAVIPSVSQLSMLNQKLTFEKILNDAVSDLRTRSSFVLDDTIYERFNGNHNVFTAETVSDANIDLLSCFIRNNNISGFGVCEWNNKYRYDIDTNSASYGNNLVTIIKDGRIEIMKNPDIKLIQPDRFAFIDFVYDKDGFSDIAEAYKNIHVETDKILNYILNESNCEIYIYRIRVYNDGTIESYDRLSKKDGIEVFSSKVTNFNTIKIPETKQGSGLAFDEYIEITKNELVYSIQIEHSENLAAHKSNIVDFILYSIGYLYDDDRIINETLATLGYKSINGKFKFASAQYGKYTIDNDTIKNFAFYQTRPEWYNNYLI